MIHLDNSNYAKEISIGLVLVDFWAEYCVPCKALKNVLERIAKEHIEIKVCEVDVEICPIIGIANNVNSLPTLILFKDRKVIDRRSGNISYQMIEDLIKEGK